MTTKKSAVAVSVLFSFRPIPILQYDVLQPSAHNSNRLFKKNVKAQLCNHDQVQ